MKTPLWLWLWLPLTRCWPLRFLSPFEVKQLFAVIAVPGCCWAILATPGRPGTDPQITIASDANFRMAPGPPSTTRTASNHVVLAHRHWAPPWGLLLFFVGGLWILNLTTDGDI